MSIYTLTDSGITIIYINRDVQHLTCFCGMGVGYVGAVEALGADLRCIGTFRPPTAANEEYRGASAEHRERASHPNKEIQNGPL